MPPVQQRHSLQNKGKAPAVIPILPSLSAMGKGGAAIPLVFGSSSGRRPAQTTSGSGKNAATSSAPSRLKICPSCGPTRVEQDDKLGIVCCVNCGSVVEENTIVAEVTFSETNKGSAVADGFQISSGQSRVAQRAGKFGQIRTGGMESRDVQLQNGHRRIQDVANQAQIKLNERHVQAAQRYFNLAVLHNFNKGRKSNNVVAACLYIVCRMEKTAHMLIDFADALSTNVYEIGATFLRLIQILHITLPIVDPALYISRFASRLDFGEQTGAVVKDANRLVQRMNRDWIQTGRRPSGICAASLFVAARIHGFNRTHREIVMVVKVCNATLVRRLKELQETPSGELSVADFQTIWLEEECNPPSYVKRKHPDAAAAADEDKDTTFPSETAAEGSPKGPTANAEKLTPPVEGDGQIANPLPISATPLDEDTRTLISETADPEEDIDLMQEEMRSILDAPETLSAAAQSLEQSTASTPTVAGKEKMRSLADILSPTDLNAHATLSDLDDDEEIAAILNVTEEEIEFKTQIWTTQNKDWIERQELKKKMAEAKLAAGEGGGDAEGSRAKRAKKRGQSNRRANLSGAVSVQEAARNLVSSKPVLSKKINYAALDGLFENDENALPITDTQATLGAA